MRIVLIILILVLICIIVGMLIGIISTLKLISSSLEWKPFDLTDAQTRWKNDFLKYAVKGKKYE